MKEKDNKKTQKKESKTRRLIIQLLLTSFVLIVLLGIFIYSIEFQLKEKRDVEKKIESLNGYNNAITLQIKDIEAKTTMARKYIKIWNTEYIPNQKLLKGINIKDIEEKIQKFATDSNISNLVLDVSPTILVGENFERGKLRTYTVLIGMKFDAITDINVFRFLDDLKEKTGYFVVIQSVSLKRTKKIDDEFLKTLTSGNIISAISGEIRIRLYGIGER